MASPRSRISYDVVDTPPVLGMKTEDGNRNEPKKQSKFKKHFFGIPGILGGAILGIIMGWAIQTSSPSETAVTWIAMPGNLFIRAIKCLVTPLVFCSLVVGMADMLAIGKAGKIGSRTAILYVTTTIVASMEGLLWVTMFRSMFSNKPQSADAKPIEFAMQCSKPGHFLSHANDTVACVLDPLFNETNATSLSDSSKFLVTDINKVFKTSEEGFTERSLTDALQGQLYAIVPDNITMAFSEGNLLSIIMFALPLGIAITMLPKDMSSVANFFRETNIVFMTMIQWVILCTPFAIVSLLASSIAGQDDLAILVSDVGTFVLCDLSCLFVHAYIFYPLLLRAFVKINPYKWLSQIVGCQLFALGCASSMATLPVTIACVDATKQVSKTVTRFICSLGATINMDGSAIGYPIAIVFMAEAEGIGHIIGSVELFLIILVSTIGAIGSGPVPAAGIVMTMTIWNSIFPQIPLPSTFAFIVATDWFIDRFQTAVNVTCDTVVARIVAEMVGETVDEEERQSLASVASGFLQHNASHKGMTFESLDQPRPDHV